MKTELKKMSDTDYFAVDAASNSALSLMKQSASHGKYRMDNPPEETPSMRLGKLLHCLVLEPDEYESQYHLTSEHDPVKPRKRIVVELIDAIIGEELSNLFFIDEGDAPRKPTGERVLELSTLMIDGATQETIDENYYVDKGDAPRKPTGKITAEIMDLIIRGKAINHYEIEPVLDRKTKEGKAEHKEWTARCFREMLKPCKQEELDKAQEYASHVLTIGERTIINPAELAKAEEYAEYSLKVGDRTVVKSDDLIVARNYVAFLQFIGDKTIITEDMLEACKGMTATILAHPKAKKLLAKGRAEHAIFWEDPKTGYPCKSKIDFLPDLNYLVDLKTTRDASLAEFSRSIAKFGYHRQDAFYTDGYIAVTGIVPKAFIFITVESKPPYAVGVYRLDPAGKEKGREEYRALLDQLVECKKTDTWPAYSQEVVEIELPRWYQ